MYEEYFRLSDAPFRLNPDPRFFFGSRSHNKAMAYLHYGLKQAEGFIVITGPVGAGKSMIIGHLIDQLNASNVVAANLLTSTIAPNELLGQILSAFRIEPEGEGRTGEIEAFEDYLFDQLNRGRRVLLIIDEAQNLPFKTLEELRMLSNIDYDGTPLFQVFLVGQPEFRTIIESDDMEQLRQRVIASYHLENLSAGETREYILHRLSVAGWQDDPAFSEDAFRKIFEETGGLPRRINTLCNRVMLYCSLEQTHEVTGEIVDLVCKELKEEKLNAKHAADPIPAPAKTENRSDEAPEAAQSGRHQPDPNENNTQKAAAARMNQASSKAAAGPSSASVLDRLRAKKSATGAVRDDERHEATLTEVASAIAAASADKAAPPPEENTWTHGSPQSDNEPPSGRDGLLRAIDETRVELKSANADLMRIRRTTTEAAERRQERRQEITKRLSRAEELLQEIEKAQE